jgi:hypothetical protein
MSKVYAEQSVAEKHIVEQCENCNLKTNSNGLYNHDNIVKVLETNEGKLNKMFLDQKSGLDMIRLLESINNEINTNNDINVNISINNDLNFKNYDDINYDSF